MESVTQQTPKDISKPVFFGFLVVGFLAMLGGIAMFAFVVPKDMNTGDVPRDVGVIFTNVFVKEMSFFTETNRYAASLGEIEIDRATCDKYNCRLTVQPDGQNYIFRLSKGGRTWAIEPKSPVPKAVPQ